ncbi:MAG: hypothetical protein ACLFPN_01950 [Methanomassiliicoccales archaeon]
MKEIAIEQEVVKYIQERDEDFRLSTSCYGPVLVPVNIKPPKVTDLQLQVEGRTIYVSRVQARFINRISSSMIWDASYLRSCSVLRE